MAKCRYLNTRLFIDKQGCQRWTGTWCTSGLVESGEGLGQNPSHSRPKIALHRISSNLPRAARQCIEPGLSRHRLKLRGQWKYLYRAVDKQGLTVDFYLSAKRDVNAAKTFLRKAMKGQRALNDSFV
jgi:hypothetical protein